MLKCLCLLAFYKSLGASKHSICFSLYLRYWREQHDSSVISLLSRPLKLGRHPHLELAPAAVHLMQKVTGLKSTSVCQLALHSSLHPPLPSSLLFLPFYLQHITDHHDNRYPSCVQNSLHFCTGDYQQIFFHPTQIPPPARLQSDVV